MASRALVVVIRDFFFFFVICGTVFFFFPFQPIILLSVWLTRKRPHPGGGVVALDFHDCVLAVFRPRDGDEWRDGQRVGGENV